MAFEEEEEKAVAFEEKEESSRKAARFGGTWSWNGEHAPVSPLPQDPKTPGKGDEVSRKAMAFGEEKRKPSRKAVAFEEEKQEPSRKAVAKAVARKMA